MVVLVVLELVGGKLSRIRFSGDKGQVQGLLCAIHS